MLKNFLTVEEASGVVAPVSSLGYLITWIDSSRGTTWAKKGHELIPSRAAAVRYLASKMVWLVKAFAVKTNT